jgi:D-sedoheptulose 7-phosphate isomerase
MGGVRGGEREADGGAILPLLLQGLDRHRASVDRLAGTPLARLGDIVLRAHATLQRGGMILACGNGGSASDAQHFVAELVGRYRDERPALAAVSLNADGAVLTCLANDYEYARVFARQVEALGRPGDMLLALSTSGRSPNVVQALETARARGLVTAALLGSGGGEALRHADLAVVVPDAETARIQECHGLMIHLMCEALDRLHEAAPGRGDGG